jgi:hypothetical protein
VRRAALVPERRTNFDASPNTVISKDLRVKKTKQPNRRTRQIRYRIRQSIALRRGVSTARVLDLCFFSRSGFRPQLFLRGDVKNGGKTPGCRSALRIKADRAWPTARPIFLQNRLISIIINLAEKAGLGLRYGPQQSVAWGPNPPHGANRDCRGRAKSNGPRRPFRMASVVHGRCC